MYSMTTFSVCVYVKNVVRTQESTTAHREEREYITSQI